MSTIEVRPSEGGDDAARFAGTVADAIAAGLRRSDVLCITKRTPRLTTIEFSGTAPG